MTGDPTPDGWLRRIRRAADLSQRQLAAALGTSPAAVGRMEAGRSRVPLPVLVRAAALAGLRLVLVDGEGREVPPMAPCPPRDQAGRRLPAHLDTRPGDVDWWHGEERYSRRRPEWTFDVVRETRDWWRERQGTPADHDQPGPGDSLAERAEARRRAAEARAAERREQRRTAFLEAYATERLLPDPAYTCSCPPGCDDLLLEVTLAEQAVRPGSPPRVHVVDCPCCCDLG